MLFTVQLTDQLPLVKARQGLIVWPIWLTNQYQNATNLTNLLAWAPSPPAHLATTQHTRGLSQQQVGTSLSGRLNNVHTHTQSNTLASDYAIWKRFVVSFFIFSFSFDFLIWFLVYGALWCPAGNYRCTMRKWMWCCLFSFPFLATSPQPLPFPRCD